jgi:signal transduction histidine kinase
MTDRGAAAPPPGDAARRDRRRGRRHRHRHGPGGPPLRAADRAAWRAERELWRDQPHRSRWLPWWVQSRIRRRVFAASTTSVCVGAALGYHLDGPPAWWQLVLGALALSAVSGALAWRIARPILLVIRAARDIGDGKLDQRLAEHDFRGEERVLAAALNQMAAAIQRQLADQRQLLAAVSHELRTPLGHMRVLVETARDQPARAGVLAELEREILLVDDLVGRLLASSRLEFGQLDRRALDVGALVTDVATAAGVAPEAIEAIGEVRAAIDPTLVRRAVANLLENARAHGGGVVAVRIERRAGHVAIEVDDAGPGVSADRRADAFRAFVPSQGGGLGLGLALVSRIAAAHGGGAWIGDRPGGGARVGLTVAAAP